jgi:preprotein translocase subunit SecE
MENNQQKWVNLSFVAAALLLAYVVFVLAVKFSVVLDFDGRVRSLDKILMGVSAALGFLLFFGLFKSKVANAFMSETVAEISKVTWPTKDETLKATIAVLIAVTIAGAILWMVDNTWVWLIGVILKV